MKKHLSVLALCARNNLCRVTALLLAMCALETLLFRIRWQQFQKIEYDLLYLNFEELLEWIPPASFAALLLLAFLLCRSGDHMHSTGYTLQRLRIPEGMTVLWKTVYNSICLLLFWAVQTAAVLGMGCWYTSALAPEAVSPQTVFLAFYRIPFLHNLLPLDNWTRYLCIGALLLALGFSTALMGCKLRRGSRFGWGMPIFLWAVLYANFREGIADWPIDAFCVMVALAAIAVEGSYLVRCWRGMEKDD